jgi:hypothetical protein
MNLTGSIWRITQLIKWLVTQKLANDRDTDDNPDHADAQRC